MDWVAIIKKFLLKQDLTGIESVTKLVVGDVGRENGKHRSPQAEECSM